MRQKRAKTYKRLMALYVQTFNFRQPFQVLDDLLLLPAAQQLDIVKLLSTCVQAEIKPMITQCCMEALYALGRPSQRTTDLAKTFERRRCNHRTPIPSSDCLEDMIGTSNKHRYVLAAQSQELRDKLERVPGLPMVHFNGRGVLVLSPPSTATVREKNRGEEERRMGDKKGLEGLEEGGNVIGIGAAEGSRGERSRGMKAPNPLSVKKKKKAPATAAGSSTVNAERNEERESERKKRQRKADDDGDNAEGPDEGARSGTVAHLEEDGAQQSRKKKKRKRRGKGEVALAIEELNAGPLGGSGGGVAAVSEDEED